MYHLSQPRGHRLSVTVPEGQTLNSTVSGTANARAGHRLSVTIPGGGRHSIRVSHCGREKCRGLVEWSQKLSLLLASSGSRTQDLFAEKGRSSPLVKFSVVPGRVCFYLLAA